jgi:F-type H+-transporting ATPase subunit b
VPTDNETDKELVEVSLGWPTDGIESHMTMRKLSLILVALLVLGSAVVLPAAAAAAPEAEAHGHGEGGVNPFSGDLGNALWTLIIFLLLLFVLGKYAWGPILQGLQGREQFIRDSLEQAKVQRDEATELLKQYEAKLASARDEVDSIMEEARRDADVLRQREEERAKEEADRMLARARREIEIATDTAIKDLYSRASRLAVDAASRIVQRELKPEDHERLIADSIASLEKMDQN